MKTEILHTHPALGIRLVKIPPHPPSLPSRRRAGGQAAGGGAGGRALGGQAGGVQAGGGGRTAGRRGGRPTFSKKNS